MFIQEFNALLATVAMYNSQQIIIIGCVWTVVTLSLQVW